MYCKCSLSASWAAAVSPAVTACPSSPLMIGRASSAACAAVASGCITLTVNCFVPPSTTLPPTHTMICPLVILCTCESAPAVPDSFSMMGSVLTVRAMATER